MPPKPYKFRDSEEIVACLTKQEARIAAWFDQREKELETIVKVAVAGNTFRAFRDTPENKHPSVVFRNWASRALSDKRNITNLKHLRSQTAYDDWLLRFSSAFQRNWRKHMGVMPPYGPSRKLPNLLLKHFVLWSDLTDNQRQRQRLIKFLHVSLDSFALIGIKSCIDAPRIPANATMSFVTGEAMYNQIQDAIRDITARAKVPAIYFDVLVWNLTHTENASDKN